MKTTVIGWYGTETIGDRAILTGIFSHLQEAFGWVDVRLGSLFPFFSSRTLVEDASFYKELLGASPHIELFDSKDNKALDAAIDSSDLLLMGGGPLMHLNALYMVEYAFKRARKKGKRTMIFGCGVGPLNKSSHVSSVMRIVSSTDSVVLRDPLSANYLENLFSKAGKNLSDLHLSIDPAVRCILDYLDGADASKKQDYIAVNLRSFPSDYGNKSKAQHVDTLLTGWVDALAERYQDHEIRLIPMHYFHLGGDDRDFLNKIRFDLERKNLVVQNEHLDLKQTMECFQQAAFNFGMRFHSVVFQSLLSGRNAILDYTDPIQGKVMGFINQIDPDGFYKGRYYNLQEDTVSAHDLVPKQLWVEEFKWDKAGMKAKLDIYTEILKKLG